MAVAKPALKLTADGDIVFPTVWITGPEAVAQKAIVRIRTFIGEYVLDRFKGIDWLTLRDGKVTDQRLQTIRAAIVAEIDDIDGVKVVASGATFANREVAVTFTATIQDSDDEAETVTAVFGVGAGALDPLSLRRLIVGGYRAA